MNSIRRLIVLETLSSRNCTTIYPFYAVRSCSDSKIITIGSVSKAVRNAKAPAFAPHGYLKHELPQSYLRHLQWMLQKDLLGQDMFLIGAPGPLRRAMALSYLEMTNQEVELITLTRDTTDSDLKQRKEILNGTSFYHDQSAVRAAVEGRILILEGIEKAERNVLPVLNNLLENREMQLEDGRLLIPSGRYDNLLKKHTQEELNQMKLVRVNEHFRVIALGIPSPPYQGHPLDPPLRSRFQAREISYTPFKEAVEDIQVSFPTLSKDVILQVFSFAHTLLSEEAKTLSLPDFPVDNLRHIFAILDKFPNIQPTNLLQRIYPASLFLPSEGLQSVNDMLKKFQLTSKKHILPSKNKIVEVTSNGDGVTGSAKISSGGINVEVTVPTGNTFGGTPTPYIMTPFHEEFLSELMQSHSVKDFCVVGPRGCGKSAAVTELARLLGYQTEPILLYQDMTARDLVQQRVTTSEGDTSWKFSPLVNAALEGKMAILDGLHRLHHGTLSVLHRLLHDRELQLYDGTRLLRHDRYDAIKAKNDFTDNQLKTLGVLRIHPSFRVAGLAEPPHIGASKGQWLTAESLTLFLYHKMRTLETGEANKLVKQLIGSTENEIKKLIDLSNKFASSSDPALRSLSQSLSLRQIIRIARRFQAYPKFDLHTAVYKACLARFLPVLPKQVLDDALTNSLITPANSTIKKDMNCIVEENVLHIGDTHCKVFADGNNSSKVPDTLFFDIKQHVCVLEEMLQDWLIGDHLLLIGNQGVGKNKLADRFLYLMNRPREYIQLHRDTTVQSLTIQPRVKDGRIHYEDSPLVSAVKTGYVLVIDEADKAPTHVTCVLKTLVECGEMLLSDGRRIIPAAHPMAQVNAKDIIVSHPDFRMIVLANRPGFPFLGNDFFGSLGDLFSCHAIDNPSAESELDLLKQYGPDVPYNVMQMLVGSFGELRDLADQGILQYPYSTREVVQIVKHMQAYPNDALANVVKNVFDFDSWSGEAKKTVLKIMHKHGIPINVAATNVNVAKRIPLVDPIVNASWRVMKKENQSELSVDIKQLKFKRPIKLHVSEEQLDPSDTRSSLFTEQQSFWNLPMFETSLVTGVTTRTDDSQPNFPDIYVATIAPTTLYTFNLKNSSCVLKSILLRELIPSTRGYNMMPRTTLATLPNDIVALHEELTNTLLFANFNEGTVSVLKLNSFLDTVNSSFRNITESMKETFFRMDTNLASSGLLTMWEHDGRKIQLIDVSSSLISSIDVPFNLSSVHTLSLQKWLLIDSDNKKWILTKNDTSSSVCALNLIAETAHSNNHMPILKVSPMISDSVLSSALKLKISAPSRIVIPGNDLAAIAVGFPELDSSDNELYLWKQKSRISSSPVKTLNPASTVAVLPESGQVIRIRDHPPFHLNKEVSKLYNASYLEITDLLNHNLSYIPILRGSGNPTWSFFARGHGAAIVLSEYGSEGVVTVDAAGGVRVWDTESSHLEQAYREWRHLIGKEDAPLRLEIKSSNTKEATGPKHGKVDPKGNPHVGGNTWAGGVGGRDTAGLGGIGGPYRLDGGHDVHQVSQAMKDGVPEEIRKAAREMGKKAFEKRLQEIRMSEYDANLYEKLISSVKPQIKSLRNVISALQAKKKERQWLRHRTDGEIDDMKLIEALAGEKNIFRQRREEDPEIGAPQTKPKRLRLVVDLSGSMYRFNGHDNRLDREIEATLMVMEAFEGFDNKFKYEIIGHSGESADEMIVNLENPPTDNKKRLDVLKTMQAHSQFCLSGDNTLEAARKSIKSLQNVDADECFVVLLSDANLDRYGISPRSLAKILTSNDSVQAYAIFIGSLGNQAEVLARELPAGHGFVCMDLATLPQILQQIFTSAMIN